MRRVGERTCVYIIDVTNKAWMEQKKINRIMLKSLTEALSKEELASLWAWLDESDEHKRMYAAIRDAHALKSAVVAKNVKTVLWKRYGRWLVAACIGFALVVAGLHTFQRKEQSTLLVEVTEKEEVTLISDGHTYIVETDSVTDEAVEQQQLMRQVPKTSGQKNHLKVPRGKVFSIRLSDGTVVRLNAMSELHFPSEFTGDRRQVALTGEAFFDVARQPDCPLHGNGRSQHSTGDWYEIQCVGLCRRETGDCFAVGGKCGDERPGVVDEPRAWRTGHLRRGHFGDEKVHFQSGGGDGLGRGFLPF